jgi:hypothetical protein
VGPKNFPYHLPLHFCHQNISEYTCSTVDAMGRCYTGCHILHCKKSTLKALISPFSHPPLAISYWL